MDNPRMRKSFAKGKKVKPLMSDDELKAFLKPDTRPRVRISVEGYDTSLPVDDVNKALVNLFTSCGEIINVTIPIDPETSLVERRAFIILRGDDAEDKALQLNGSDVGGWKVLVQVTPEEDEETIRYADALDVDLMFDRRLFGVDVRGYDPSLPDDDVKSTLINHFSSCGDITIVLLGIMDRCAKIYFSQQDAEGKALKFNGSEVGGWKVTVRLVATVVNNPPFVPPRSQGIKHGYACPEHYVLLGREFDKKVMAFKKRRGLA